MNQEAVIQLLKDYANSEDRLNDEWGDSRSSMVELANDVKGRCEAIGIEFTRDLLPEDEDWQSAFEVVTGLPKVAEHVRGSET